MFTVGAPVTCTNADTAYPLTTSNILVKVLKISQKSTNTGVVCIGNASIVPATGVGVAAQLGIPATPTIEKWELTEVDAPNGILLSDFFVSSSHGGDIVLWGYDTQ